MAVRGNLRLASAAWLALVALASAPAPSLAAVDVISCPTMPRPAGSLPMALAPVQTLRDSMLALARAAALARPAPPAAGGATGDETWSPIRFLGFEAPGLVVDTHRDRLIAFGGEAAQTPSLGAEVFERPLAGGAWTLLATQGPSPEPRMDHLAIYDPRRGRLIVYAGLGTGGAALWSVWALDLEGPPVWSQLTPPDSTPGFLVGAMAAYDPVGDRMLVFGGHAMDSDPVRTDTWALNLAGAPAWSALHPAGGPPPPRCDGAMVFDPVGRRMLLYGGCPGVFGTGALNDVWALSLGDSVAWQLLTPGGDPAPARHSFAAAFDPGGDRLLVFSGRDSNFFDPPVDGAWALDLGGTPAWHALSPAGSAPPARYFARAVFDSLRDRLILFGGTSDDTWQLALGDSPAWTQLEPSHAGAPYRRFLSAAVYDPLRDRTWFLGGEYMNEIERDFFYTPLSDLWSLSFDPRPEWQQVVRDSEPPPRHGHSLVLDPVGDRLIVFGGAPDPADPYAADLWQLPLAGGPWSRLAAAGTPPAGRYLHSAVYDSRRRRMLVFGGWNATGALDDLWSLSLDDHPTWTRLGFGGDWPSPRWGQGAIYDPVGDRMIVFGGAGSRVLNDTWQLRLGDAPAWSPLPGAQSPPARTKPALVYDALRARAVLFGGEDSSGTALDDSWTLPLDDPSGWRLASLAGAAPGPRWGGAAAFDVAHDRIVLFGGALDACGDGLGDVWTMASAVPVVVALALPRVVAHPGDVLLTWQAPAGAPIGATVERRTEAGDWAALAAIQPDASGLLAYEDRSVQPGATYAYRLTWSEAGDARQTSATWVSVPRLHFALAGATPNPAARGLVVALSLPDAAPARLDVLDLAGRRVLSRAVGPLGPGDHVVSLAASGTLPAGVYLIRLERGGETQVRRVCVLR